VLSESTRLFVFCECLIRGYRICLTRDMAFNVGASDARKLARELVGEVDGRPTETDPNDLLSLRVGEAICRIGRNVLPIATLRAPEDGSDEVRDEVVRRSRTRFGRPMVCEAVRQQPG